MYFSILATAGESLKGAIVSPLALADKVLLPRHSAREGSELQLVHTIRRCPTISWRRVMNGFLLLGACLAGLLGIGNIVAGDKSDGPKEPAGKFKIVTKKDSDSVKVEVDKDKTVFAVHSRSGIGEAAIERQDAEWPKAVVLRLHLKGLESLRLRNGNVTLDAAVSVRNGKPVVRLWKDGKEDA